MNKRSFLRLVSSAALSPMLGKLSAMANEQRLTNWSGNVVYGTDNIQHAATTAEVQARVRSAAKLKVLGTRHCFNTIADSHHELLRLEQMQEMTLDPSSGVASVGAAVKYGQLGPYIDERGFALHNLASLPHISVAGACATATHGSGEKNGNLATSVTGLEMVTGTGDVVKLGPGSRDFKGAVVGLGALGVVTRISLKVEPTYKIRQYVYQELPLQQMRDHFDEIEASGYSVSLFTDWRHESINELWIKSRVGSRHEFSAPDNFFGARLAKENLHPIFGISAENTTQQLGVPGPWYDRLPHFRMGFTPSAGAELQTEYLLPRRHAVDAILAVQRLSSQVSPHLLISEIRTIAADDLWMSTAYQRDSVAIHFTWKPDWPSVRKVLPVIEKELGPYQPRPHWGKLFTISRSELRKRYEQFDSFLQLAKQYDPNGKFRNEFLTTYIFG